MNTRSIRFRLAAWYFAILACGMVVFSLGTWLAVRHSLLHSVDDTLEDRVIGVKKFMDEQTEALSLSEIRDEFREHSVLGPGGDLFQVADAAGQWLYRSVPLEEIDLPIRSPRELGNAPVYEGREVQGAPLRLMSQRITVRGNLYTVQVAAPMHEIYEAFDRLKWFFSVAIPVLLMTATAGGYWISRRALAPVDRITTEARQISIGNLSERLTVPSTGDELQRLSETLNSMLARLDDSVRTVRQFTADASHEFRAPVTLIRTTAELALRKDRTKEEYRQALQQVLTESEQTTQLVDSLMLLARADSGADGLNLIPMDLADAIREACRQGEKLAQAKGIELSWTASDRPLLVRGDPQALRRLFLILIDNAVKYTPPGGKVSVATEVDEGSAFVKVKDTGIGIAEQDLPHVFDRFWRADKARSREDGSMGLGLSIAKWIADRHSADVSVMSKLGGGSTFAVRIPLES
jgi:heavy metal sensor kinase